MISAFVKLFSDFAIRARTISTADRAMRRADPRPQFFSISRNTSLFKSSSTDGSSLSNLAFPLSSINLESVNLIVEDLAKYASFYYRRALRHSLPRGPNQVASPANNLYRQASSRLEQAANIDKQISKLEDDIRELKIDFDIYFNGSVKRPPLEARARL